MNYIDTIKTDFLYSFGLTKQNNVVLSCHSIPCLDCVFYSKSDNCFKARQEWIEQDGLNHLNSLLPFVAVKGAIDKETNKLVRCKNLPCEKCLFDTDCYSALLSLLIENLSNKD